MVAQEYFNHNSVLWKVFVIGEYFCTVKKRSVPNLPKQYPSIIYFDSQKPLQEQILNSLTEDSLKKKVEIVEKQYESENEPPLDLLKALTKSMSNAFKLSLFGYDVIRDIDTNSFGVIDINYFPSYTGVEDFDLKLLAHLSNVSINRIK